MVVGKFMIPNLSSVPVKKTKRISAAWFLLSFCAHNNSLLGISRAANCEATLVAVLEHLIRGNLSYRTMNVYSEGYTGIAVKHGASRCVKGSSRVCTLSGSTLASS